MNQLVPTLHRFVVLHCIMPPSMLLLVKRTELRPRDFLNVVIWMLQMRILCQLRTYIFLNVPVKGKQQVLFPENALRISRGYQSFLVNTDLQPTERSFLQQLDDGSPEYKILMKYSSSPCYSGWPANICRIYPYCRGRHHLEEIMWRANISREELMSVISKYEFLTLLVAWTQVTIFFTLVLSHSILDYMQKEK